MKILVTGAAGFIGLHLCLSLLKKGHELVGLDNINDYYDPNLKLKRLESLGIKLATEHKGKKLQSDVHANFIFVKADLKDTETILSLFETEKFDAVCNLAAQAGVRYSLENPSVYIESNVSGFLNILEGCRHTKVKHLVFASSSSVYGLNNKMPLRASESTEHPISLYAATKKSNEMMAHCYSYLFNLPVTGLRFFTVYGPWGRPDMALFKFTKAITEDKPVDIYNNGSMVRDFTYVDDIVEGIVRVISKAPAPNENWNAEQPDPSSSAAAYKIYNIGNSSPVQLMDYVKGIEKALNKEAIKNFLPLQPGDVLETFADMKPLNKDFDYQPATKLQDGINSFIDWYTDYYEIETVARKPENV